MAQLGDLVRAKALLRSAARAFGPKEALARARCVVAEAEIALVSRDLSWPAKTLDAARATLEQHGDRVNAAHARYLEVRRLLLIGRIDEAERTLAELDPGPSSRLTNRPRTRGRRHRDAAPPHERGTRRASPAPGAPRDHARIPALTAEVESALRSAEHACRAPDCARQRATPAARRSRERCWHSKAFVVDACRYVVRHETHGGLARDASGVVRARPRARRSVAGRRARGTRSSRAPSDRN